MNTGKKDRTFLSAGHLRCRSRLPGIRQHGHNVDGLSVTGSLRCAHQGMPFRCTGIWAYRENHSPAHKRQVRLSLSRSPFPSLCLYWDIRDVLVCCSFSNNLGLLLTLLVRFSNPSAGGWADCIVLFKLNNSTQHVVELQFVHQNLMVVRQRMNAHHAYSMFREGMELLETFGFS